MTLAAASPAVVGFVISGFVLAFWSFCSALRRSRTRFKHGGYSKIFWLVIETVGFFTGFGVFTAVAYWIIARPKNPTSPEETSAPAPIDREIAVPWQQYIKTTEQTDRAIAQTFAEDQSGNRVFGTTETSGESWYNPMAKWSGWSCAVCGMGIRNDELVSDHDRSPEGFSNPHMHRNCVWRAGW
jgi:hypothetical protein